MTKGFYISALFSVAYRQHWHEGVGDATFGDAIMDRLVHHAHRITLTGGSLRTLGAGAATDPA